MSILFKTKKSGTEEFIKSLKKSADKARKTEEKKMKRKIKKWNNGLP